MESGILWREEVQWVHDNEYPDVALSHMYADNGAMQLVRWPKQFDVIVTDNLFGDVLSDCAAMLTGSLGMLPSASLGAPMANGRPSALYEPVHGSAPDIAGTGKANPIACILSFAMALRYSFDLGDEAVRIEQAVEKVLADGVRTADLMGPEGGTPVTHARDGRGDHRRDGREPLVFSRIVTGGGRGSLCRPFPCAAGCSFRSPVRLVAVTARALLPRAHSRDGAHEIQPARRASGAAGLWHLVPRMTWW